MEPQGAEQLNERRRAMPLWLKYGVIALIAAGVFFRFYNLDKKVYWIDETNSSLRTLGYTRPEMIDQLFTGDLIQVSDLRQFQQLDPDRGWGDSIQALSATAEHTPLYFLAARAWIGLVGHSVAVMRGVAAFFSLLVFPALYWLCQELFRAEPDGSSRAKQPLPDAQLVGWIAIGLFAVMPIHLVYAQEARPYSLLSLLIVTSSALLLRALRLPSRRIWLLYALSLILGLYSQLLFSLVLLTHAVYVLLAQGHQAQGHQAQGQPQDRQRWRRGYWAAAGAACLSLTPWLLNLAYNWEKVKQSTTSIYDGSPEGSILDRWFLNLNIAFLSRELGAANLLLVLVVILALFLLCRIAPRRSWLFVLLLVAVPFVALALPDLIAEGRRSSRIRYLFPSLFGLHLALAYLFAAFAVWAKTWQDWFWRTVMLALVIAGLHAAVISSQAVVWWNKSTPRSSYYPIVGEMINQSANPLVVITSSPTDTLAFSAWLRPDIAVQLPRNPRKFKLADGYDPTYLLNPSNQIKRVLTRRGYQLSLIYADYADPAEVEERLWLVKPPASK